MKIVFIFIVLLAVFASSCLAQDITPAAQVRLDTRAATLQNPPREISVKDRRTFKEVKIREVIPNGIKIMHSDGGAFINIRNMNPDTVKQFGLDMDEAIAYEKTLPPPLPTSATVIMAKKPVAPKPPTAAERHQADVAASDQRRLERADLQEQYRKVMQEMLDWEGKQRAAQAHHRIGIDYAKKFAELKEQEHALLLQIEGTQ